MGVSNNFEKDFSEATQFFPKLTCKKDQEKQRWVVSGELDILDIHGDYWDTYKIALYFPFSYPYCKPLVQELSFHINRNDDWHIDKKGFCCVDIEHRILVYETLGINLTKFLKEKVYPYFSNQTYKRVTGTYADGEYKHNFEGVIQYYKEDLGIETDVLAINILEAILQNKMPGRNEPCICGKGKFKHCHLKSVEPLKLLSKERLVEDLDGFVNYKYPG